MRRTRRLLASLDRSIAFLDALALTVGAWLVVAIAALVAADVLGRTVFGQSISGTVELARNTVVLIVFCQVPAAILEGKMLRVVAIFSRLPARWQLRVEATAALLAAMIFAGLIFSAIEPMTSAFRSGEADGLGSLKVPMGPVRAAVIVLWALGVASSLVVLFRCASDRPVVASPESLG